MMVRRFESSTHVFSITLDRVIESSQRIIKYYDEGVIPVYPRNQLPDIEDLFDMSTADDIDIDDLDPEKDTKLEKAKSKGLYFIKTNQLKESYIADVKNDLEILISSRGLKILKKEFQDPKTNAIINFINKQFERS